jgi:hypothetical protein
MPRHNLGDTRPADYRQKQAKPAEANSARLLRCGSAAGDAPMPLKLGLNFPRRPLAPGQITLRLRKSAISAAL